MATQVGEAVIKLTFDGKDVQASLSKVESNVEKTGKSTGTKWGSAWAVAAGNIISKGVTKVASLVTSYMGKAISRLDTMENFPKVMTALGYSAEEAEKSVSDISDALDGLPTTLDGAINDIQKLAATMGNLDQGMVNATSVGLALNDMFLAGGKGTEAASAAMEQFNQMLASGRVDMQSWRSMVNAAPGQMNQLAKSLLGATANQQDLYEAMKEGTVTFDDFNAAVVKLDKEGGEGFASFYDQAVAATGGIETQLENISTSLTKVVSAALSGNISDVNKYINQLANRVANVAPTLIQGFSTAFVALAKALPGMITQMLPAILEGINTLVQGVFEAMPLFAQAIVDNIPVVVEGVMQLLRTIMEAAPTIIPQLLNTITQGIITLAEELTKPDNLALILEAAITLLLELVEAIPEILTALIEALPTIIENIVTFLTDPENLQKLIEGAIQLFLGLVMAVPQILGALLEAFGKLVANMWDGITQFFGDFAGDFGEFIGDIFKGAINGVITFIENFINIPIDLINGFLWIINSAFGFLGVDIGYIDRLQLPRLAQGGVVDGATAAIIGEEGQEAVLPLEHNTDNWAGVLASTLVVEMQEQEIGGAGVTVYMTNNIDNRLDAEEIGRVMMQSIRRAV